MAGRLFMTSKTIARIKRLAPFLKSQVKNFEKIGNYDEILKSNWRCCYKQLFAK
jgi:hypothetical protein